jgi:hypothetical protein
MYCLRSCIRSYAAYNFSCINFKRPDDGSQLELKHAAMNKLIKTVCVTDLIHVLVTQDVCTPGVKDMHVKSHTIMGLTLYVSVFMKGRY